MGQKSRNDLAGSKSLMSGSQLLAKAAVESQIRGYRIFFQGHSHGCWQEAVVPYHVVIYIRLHVIWQLEFSGVNDLRKRE